MKVAIIYASVHHENTKKVVEAIAGENVVDLIDATKEKERDLSGYDLIGFASGVYYGKFHQTVLNFASVNLPANKNVFLICTCGGSAAFQSIEEITPVRVSSSSSTISNFIIIISVLELSHLTITSYHKNI